MSLPDNINNDLKLALKGGRNLEVEVLRGLSAALHNKAIEKRGQGEGEDLTDEEAAGVLSKELKKRKEAVDLYRQGGRMDLVDKERKEAVIIQKYLPALMSEEEVERVIDAVLASLENESFSNVMRAVMAKLKGKADGKTVSKIVNAKLQEKLRGSTS